MRHKYLPRVIPRVRAGVLALGAAAGSVTACSDPTIAVAVDRLAPVLTLGTLPAGDTLPQRGFDLPITISGQGTVGKIELVTDAGTAAERVTSLVSGYAYFSGIGLANGGTSFTVWLPHALPDGRHTFGVRVTGDSGHTGTAAFPA